MHIAITAIANLKYAVQYNIKQYSIVNTVQYNAKDNISWKRVLWRSYAVTSTKCLLRPRAVCNGWRTINQLPSVAVPFSMTDWFYSFCFARRHFLSAVFRPLGFIVVGVIIQFCLSSFGVRRRSLCNSLCSGCIVSYSRSQHIWPHLAANYRRRHRYFVYKISAADDLVFMNTVKSPYNGPSV